MTEKFWCIHVPGPDDLLAMPSKEVAESFAARHNAAMDEYWAALKRTKTEFALSFYPPLESIKARVIEWPYDAGTHARELEEFKKHNTDDDYATAKDKLNKLLCVLQDIGAYFAKQESAQSAAEPVSKEWDSLSSIGNRLHNISVEQHYAGNEKLSNELGEFASLLWIWDRTRKPTVPPAIPAELRQKVLELCETIIDAEDCGALVDDVMDFNLPRQIREMMGEA